MDKKEEPKEEMKAVFPNLVDVVLHEERSAFCILEDGELNLYFSYETNGEVYIPPPKSKIPWLLPRGEEVLRYHKDQAQNSNRIEDAHLFDDLRLYHETVSELPDERYYTLLATWDIHTYLIEHFQFSPIICLYAIPERGKSRTGKSMAHVCYRGIQVESLREAYILRFTEYFKGAIFFDVMNLWKDAKQSRSEDIMLHRFERGAIIYRVNNPEKGAFRDMDTYTVFGPTIIGTNEDIHGILGSRSIYITMPETEKIFGNDIKPENALPLKERLLGLRARYLNEKMPEVSKPCKGRLGDFMRPLLQTIQLVRPEYEKDILSLIEDFQKERMTEASESIEGNIIKILLELESEVENNRLPVDSITDMVNEDKPERYHYGSRTIGSKLKSLGFKKGKTTDGKKRAVFWDQELLMKLVAKYGISKTTSETSKLSETSEERSIFEEISDDLDDLDNMDVKKQERVPF